MDLALSLIFDSICKHFDAELTHPDRAEDPVLSRPMVFTGDAGDSRHLRILPEGAAIPDTLPPGAYITSRGDINSTIAKGAYLIKVSDVVGTFELFNTLQGIFDNFDAWESGVTSIIENDRGYKELIQFSTEYYHAVISLMEPDFEYVAYSRSMSNGVIIDNKLAPEVVSAHLTNPEFERVQTEKDVFEYPFWEKLHLGYNFTRNGEYIGRLLVTDSGYYSVDAYKFLLRVLAKRIETMLLKYGSFMKEDASILPVRQLLSALLNRDTVERSYIINILSSCGWAYDDEYELIRLQPEFRHEWKLHSSYFAAEIESRWPYTAVVEHDSHLVVLINHSRRSGQNGLSENLSYFVRDNLLLATVSRKFRDLGDVSIAYRQAEIAEQIGRAHGGTDWILRFDDCALEYWTQYGSSGFTPEQICSPAILALRRRDREGGTEYYRTLRTLMETGFNYSAAADRLYIHRTTLISRIKRIVDVTGLDLDDRDALLYLELSYRYLDSHDPK